MLLSALVILFIGLVTYYHYTQGLFTSIISFGCALMALLVAFGYYETVAAAMGQGKMIDLQAGALLMVLFGFTYLILRVIFDSVVPGNVSFPLYVDRIGAAVFGLIVGILGVGTFAVAIQLMPMGATILMAARYPMTDTRAVVLPTTALNSLQAKDSAISHELATNSLDSASAQSLWVPADSWVISIAGLASAGGLGGDQSFSDIHPDLLTEAFADRLGADTSTNHTIYNTAKRMSVDVTSVFTLSAGATALDAEIPDIRPDRKSLTLANKSTDGMLVIRAMFQDDASDKDGILRITPAAIRLVIDGVTYHPVGWMADSGTIAINRLDDQIPVQMSGKFRGADFVFDLPKSISSRLIVAGKIKPEAGFVEFKLFGRVDLSGKPVAAYTGPSDAIGIIEKPTSPLGKALAGNAKS